MIEHERVYHENQMLDYERSRVAKHTVMIPYYYAQSLLQLLVERSFSLMGKIFFFGIFYLKKSKFLFFLRLIKFLVTGLGFELIGFLLGIFFQVFELFF